MCICIYVLLMFMKISSRSGKKIIQSGKRVIIPECHRVNMTRTSASTPLLEENMTGSHSMRHEVSGTIKQENSPPKSKEIFLFENERGSFFLG